MVAVAAHPQERSQRRHRHPRHPPRHPRHPPPLAVKLASFGETSPERPPAAKAGPPHLPHLLKAGANEAVAVVDSVAAVVPVAVDRSFRAACSSASSRCPLTSRRSSWPE